MCTILVFLRLILIIHVSIIKYLDLMPWNFVHYYSIYIHKIGWPIFSFSVITLHFAQLSWVWFSSSCPYFIFARWLLPLQLYVGVPGKNKKEGKEQKTCMGAEHAFFKRAFSEALPNDNSMNSNIWLFLSEKRLRNEFYFLSAMPWIRQRVTSVKEKLGWLGSW